MITCVTLVIILYVYMSVVTSKLLYTSVVTSKLLYRIVVTSKLLYMSVVTSKLLAVMKKSDNDVQYTLFSAAILSAKPDLGGDV